MFIISVGKIYKPVLFCLDVVTNKVFRFFPFQSSLFFESEVCNILRLLGDKKPILCKGGFGFLHLR